MTKKLNKELILTHDTASWEEEGVHYVYSPALDLIGYGGSVAVAKDAFDNYVMDFLEYQGDRETLYNVLKGLRWTVSEKAVIPPSIEEALKYSKFFSNLNKKHNLVIGEQFISTVIV